jgi:hypothetical protein
MTLRPHDDTLYRHLTKEPEKNAGSKIILYKFVDISSKHFSASMHTVVK